MVSACMQNAENGTFISQTKRKMKISSCLPNSVAIKVLLEIPLLIVVKIFVL